MCERKNSEFNRWRTKKEQDLKIGMSWVPLARAFLCRIFFSVRHLTFELVWRCGNNEIWCAINFWISATCCIGMDRGTRHTHTHTIRKQQQRNCTSRIMAAKITNWNAYWLYLRIIIFSRSIFFVLHSFVRQRLLKRERGKDAAENELVRTKEWGRRGADIYISVNGLFLSYLLLNKNQFSYAIFH